MALGETARLIASIELDPRKFNAGVGSALGKLGKLEGGVGRMGKGFGQVAGGLARTGAIIGTAVVGGITAAAKLGADFEAQLNTINTIARATPEGLQAIGDSIRGIARDTGKPLEELTQGYYDLLSAGIQAKDATNVLTQANTLAIGGLASTAETVDLLTTAINVYGGDASKAAEFTDDFATAIERGKVTAADLAGSYAQVAPLAKSLGIENAELAAGYATLTAAGTAAAEASTQMASAMTALLKKTPGLEKLEKTTGKNYAALAGKKGLNVALEQMRVDAEKAGIELIDLVGRKEALLYILQTTGDNLAAYNADLAAMGTNAGTAAEQMSERQKGLAFEIGRLGANLKDAGLELAAGFLPALSRSAGKLTEFLNTSANRTQLRAIGEDIGKAIDSIDWGKVLDGAKAFWEILKDAAGVAKGLFDIVNTLPTEIKAAGLGLLGLDKLSGGLLSSGVGNIAGGLAETIARAIGSKLPGLAGKLFVQPVLVTNWPPGIGAGGGGAAAGASGKFIAGTLLSGAALVAALAWVQENINMPKAQEQAGKNITSTEALIARGDAKEIQTALDGVKNSVANLSGLDKVLYDLNANGVKVHTEGLIGALEGALTASQAKTFADWNAALKPIAASIKAPTSSPPDVQDAQRKAAQKYDSIHAAIETSGNDTARKMEQAKAAIDMAKRATDAAKTAITSASRRDAEYLAGVIRASRATTIVNVSMSSSIRVSSGTTTATKGYMTSTKIQKILA